MVRCPKCDYGVFVRAWMKLYHCPKCGMWWKKKEEKANGRTKKKLHSKKYR